MNQTFQYDVFLSHSSKDKPAARELAERLRRDGLRVWFDEWEIKPGDPILLKIEEGLGQARTLALLMSAHADASEWVTFERHSALFRDPTNQQRRFIPIRLDDAEIKDTLKQFAYVDWRQKENKQYKRLLSEIKFRNPRSGLGEEDRMIFNPVEDTSLSDIRKKMIAAQSKDELQNAFSRK